MLKNIAAVILWVMCAATWVYGGALEPPAGGSFSGGTVTGATTFTSPVVLTGDNAGGVGTLRIRPADEDTQVVLCEASNNAATEMCSAYQHLNTSVTASYGGFGTNMYFDSAGALTRYWTSAGVGRVFTAASSTAAGNISGLQVYGTGGAAAGQVGLAATAAATSTFTVGSTGTVTTDIRGPILNGGSATCNGILAGNLCINDDITVYGANGLITTQATNATAATGLVLYTSGSVNSGALFFGNASVSDADFASKVVMRGVGYPLSMQRTDAVAAGTTVFEVMDNTSATGAVLFTVDGDGNTFLNTAATRTKGTITLAAGTGTATVSSGCTPTCSDTTAVNAVQCSVSGTTLTANGTGTDVISYHCF